MSMLGNMDCHDVAHWAEKEYCSVQIQCMATSNTTATCSDGDKIDK